MRPVRARVLSVLRDGAATSVVAQLLHSNAVLKLAVGRWAQEVPDTPDTPPAPSFGTNASKPANFNANTLKPGHEVLLRVLACAPPLVTVEIARAEAPAEAAEASETSETANAAEAAAASAATNAAAPRKRPCLGRLP
jgi:hypothetical protein